MRVCIHIGAPKTGSSAIQYFLRNNRSKLEKYGYFYPEHRTDKNDVSGGHAELGSAVIAGDMEKAADTVSGWLQEAQARKLTLLISSEALYGRISEVQELFQGHDVQIFAYFRNPVEALVSNHNQSIKRHFGRLPLVDFLEQRATPNNRGVNGEVFFDWVKVFGPQAVRVRPYNPSAFKKDRIEYDFLDMLGVRGFSARSFRLEKRLINTSYTSGALELKRLLNFVLDPDAPKDSVEVDWALQGFSDKASAKRSAVEKAPVEVNPEVLALLVEGFKPALERIRSEVLENCPEDFWRPVTVVPAGTGPKRSELAEVFQAFSHLQQTIPATVQRIEQKLAELLESKPAGELPFAVLKLANVMGVTFREPSQRKAKPSVVAGAVKSVLSGNAKDADYLRELAKVLAEQGLLEEAVKVIEKARNLRPNGQGIIKLHESYLERLKVQASQSSEG
ncbi:MAG: hypothetical protein CMN81_16670 [Spongiibacter sp.]|nr:hypothetical protein [Spongiibacter sp.]HCP21144.1 hypothetical protein [Marinobacter nauticus]|tara:strand:- start:14409 stop:15755 length:1347 start_codon:yes stop_codon:yes gene_type:complete